MLATTRVEKVNLEPKKLSPVHIYEHTVGTFCESDISLFEAWEFALTTDNERMLTDSGKEEQRMMGQRFRARFPGLLDEPFTQEKYLVSRRKKIDPIITLVLSPQVPSHNPPEGEGVGRGLCEWGLS